MKYIEVFEKYVKALDEKGFKDAKSDVLLLIYEVFNFDFSKLLELSDNKRISKIKFYTEIDSIKDILKGDKFEEISL